MELTGDCVGHVCVGKVTTALLTEVLTQLMVALTISLY